MQNVGAQSKSDIIWAQLQMPLCTGNALSMWRYYGILLFQLLITLYIRKQYVGVHSKSDNLWSQLNVPPCTDIKHIGRQGKSDNIWSQLNVPPCTDI